MNSLLFLCALAGVMVVGALSQSAKTKHHLKKYSGKAGYWTQAISMLMLTAHMSEMVRVVEHVSVVHLAAAFLLLAIAVAAKSGTDSEYHG